MKESPYLEHAFRLPLVEDDGEEGKSAVVGPTLGEIGMVVKKRLTKSRRFPLIAWRHPPPVQDSRTR